MSKADSIRVKTLRYHTFNGKPHDEGDVYEVVGDSIQSATQYYETLKANQMAEVAAEAKATSAKAPEKAEEKPEAEKPKSKPVEPMTTADMKAEAASKTIDHRKPSKDVPIIKK